APAQPVPAGRARSQVARDLQRAAQCAGPSDRAAGDGACLPAPARVPDRLLPPGRPGPQRRPASRPARVRRLRRLPAAAVAAAELAPAARGVRSLCRAHDGDADSTPSHAREQRMNANPLPSSTPSSLEALNDWVAQVAALTKPDRIHWCDGSDAEFDALVAGMQVDGTLLPLNRDTHPGSWLHRSDPDDVARVEHLTFVCHEKAEDGGP